MSKNKAEQKSAWGLGPARLKSAYTQSPAEMSFVTNYKLKFTFIYPTVVAEVSKSKSVRLPVGA